MLLLCLGLSRYHAHTCVTEYTLIIVHNSTSIEVCEVGRAWPVLLVISMPNAVCTLYSVISAVFKLGKQSHYIPIVMKRQIVIKIHLKFIKCFGISFVVITAYQCRLA